MTPETASDPIPRMRAEDRRELVLTAATAVFGERGYFGTTTDAVARAANVSQPYVVRMFGTKEALFLAVLERALERLIAAFRGAIDENPASPREQIHERLGAAYGDLITDRGLLLSLMHAFVLGSDPEIGRAARRGFLEVYRLLRHEAGFTADEAQAFLGSGMLLNTLIGLRMADDFDDPDVRELIECAAPTKAEILVRMSRATPA
ncbi:TetR/AcrR family transcriptional regulator [Pseudolysinimonas yzui]|uniref:TetR family transcriptional regulator n=1 Tax=Pseudolysinimonas yzui TaxID=2708254 RepID=A0A8J3LYW4_9MICO|nr:TetR/AcrR family transcriptional regulator [Pseudolysinimonas yzui]GHF07735.1 TetR family transcriptional regulator [Pseudolysinimonas yzui]